MIHIELLYLMLSATTIYIYIYVKAFNYLHIHSSSLLNRKAHKSYKRAFLIDPLSVVVVVVVVVVVIRWRLVVNFSHFHLLKNHWAHFNQTWHRASLSERDSCLKGHPLFQGEIISKQRRLIDGI